MYSENHSSFNNSAKKLIIRYMKVAISLCLKSPPHRKSVVQISGTKEGVSLPTMS